MTLRSLIHIWAWFRWQDPWLGTDFIMGCGSLGRGECILQFGEMWIAVAEHKARRPLKLSITLLPPLYMHATLLNKRLRLFPLFLKLVWYYLLDCNYILTTGVKKTDICFLLLGDSHCSVQFSCSVVSNSLWPHESQHARPPCPSPTPRVHSDSRPSSQWCHPAISSSVNPFSSCPQSLPASESFPMSQLFAWGSQSTGVSALASFLPKKSQGWSPPEWTGWISLQSKGLSRVFSNTTAQKHQFFGAQLSSQSNSHLKNHSLD